MSFWDGTQWVTETGEVAEAPPAPERPSRTKRLAGAAAEGALIAALTFGLIAGSAFAGRGGGGGGGKPSGGSSTASLNVHVLNDRDDSGGLSYGDTFTFTSNTTNPGAEVGFRCYQGANFVFDGYVSLYDSWLAKDLTLESSNWDQSQSANCTAKLFYYDGRGREQVIKAIAVTVAP